MDIKEYFNSKNGIGVLSTADEYGNVNAAVYSKPHVMEDGAIAFIMNKKLSHDNLQKNPKAAYLFIESGSKRDGIRLYLEKIREEDNSDVIDSLRRHGKSETDPSEKKLFLVYFKITNIRPLVD